MSNYEKQLRTVMRCLAAESERDRELARAEIRAMLAETCSPAPLDLDDLLADALLDLGVPDNLAGYKYLTAAIKAVINGYGSDGKTLYHHLSDMFHTSYNIVERGIRYAIEISWERMNYNTMCTYFGNIVDPCAGKPANITFIVRVANALQRRLREVS